MILHEHEREGLIDKTKTLMASAARAGVDLMIESEQVILKWLMVDRALVRCNRCGAEWPMSVDVHTRRARGRAWRICRVGRCNVDDARKG